MSINSVIIKEDATKVFRYLAQNSDCREKMENAIPQLVPLLGADSVIIKENVSIALAHLAQNSVYQVQIVGEIPQLVSLLSTGSDETRKNASLALEHLAQNSDYQRKIENAKKVYAELPELTSDQPDSNDIKKFANDITKEIEDGIPMNLKKFTILNHYAQLENLDGASFERIFHLIQFAVKFQDTLQHDINKKKVSVIIIKLINHVEAHPKNSSFQNLPEEYDDCKRYYPTGRIGPQGRAQYEVDGEWVTTSLKEVGKQETIKERKQRREQTRIGQGAYKAVSKTTDADWVKAKQIEFYAEDFRKGRLNKPAQLLEFLKEKNVADLLGIEMHAFAHPNTKDNRDKTQKTVLLQKEADCDGLRAFSGLRDFSKLAAEKNKKTDLALLKIKGIEYFIEWLNQLNELKKHGLFNPDFKLENTLIVDGRPILSDFGSINQNTSSKNTTTYPPPKGAHGKNSKQLQCYAVGCALMHLVEVLFEERISLSPDQYDQKEYRLHLFFIPENNCADWNFKAVEKKLIELSKPFPQYKSLIEGILDLVAYNEDVRTTDLSKVLNQLNLLLAALTTEPEFSA